MPKKRLPRTGQVIEQTGRFGSKFKPRFVGIAKLLGEAGKTDAEAAEYFGVSLRTIHYWKIDHPEFAAALSMAKAIADARVEESVYRQALGFYVDKEEIKVIEGKIVRVMTREFIPPSTTAALAWLNNRKRGEWSRNPEPEPPPPEAPKTIDITPENARQIARRVALTLVKGDKVG